MLDNLPGLEGRLDCAVIGAGGGLGGAFATAFAGSRRVHRLFCLSRRPIADAPGIALSCDVTREEEVAQAALAMGKIDCLVVATGMLHEGEHIRPEKDWREIDPAAMARSFAVNAIGPALALKHMAPCLPRDRPSLIAVLSARVGSIGDNRLGGWYSYRASKAALNQLLRTFSIELRRKRPEAILIGLHPGTVQTGLSAPFSAGRANLLSPAQSAGHLLDVMARMTPRESGLVFDWRGEIVPE